MGKQLSFSTVVGEEETNMFSFNLVSYHVCQIWHFLLSTRLLGSFGSCRLQRKMQKGSA